MDLGAGVRKLTLGALAISGGLLAAGGTPIAAQSADKPNIVMLMTDDTGWNDFGAYSNGGATLGHPTPNIDKMAKEGAVFTSWYGQASCTAGRASFITGRIPIRSALSIVVAPGDENYLNQRLRRLPNSLRKTATLPTSPASGTWATSRYLPNRTWLRRDEGVRRLLRWRLFLPRYLQVVPSLVPVLQP